MPGRYVAAASTFTRNWSGVKFKRHADSPLKKKARRGFHGYPVATIAFFDPDDTRATQAAVAMLNALGAEPAALERWFTEGGRRSDRCRGGRRDPPIRAGSWGQTGGGDGSNHRLPASGGGRLPRRKACPHCPFWAHRDRCLRLRVAICPAKPSRRSHFLAKQAANEVSKKPARACSNGGGTAIRVGRPSARAEL